MTARLSEPALNYLRSSVDMAAMPGAESLVDGGSHVVSHTSAQAVAAAGRALLEAGGAAAFASEAERLACVEQVFGAALDAGRVADAARLLAALDARFPPAKKTDAKDAKDAKDEPRFASLRVAKLKGMLLEAQGQYEDALELYNAALKQDETYAPIIKRKVAVLIDQGKTHDAITALTHYLDHFHADLEAWTTLSQVYLRSQMFQQAAFALEECMIMGGFNFLYHIRYAEVNMTLNRPAVALKYFCSAVEVTESGGGALRAWYGVRQASHALLENHNKVSLGNTGSNPKQSGKKGAVAAASHGIQESVDNDVVSPEEWKALNALAGERIEAIYKAKKVSTENIEVVKGWLNTVSA